MNHVLSSSNNFSLKEVFFAILLFWLVSKLPSSYCTLQYSWFYSLLLDIWVKILIKSALHCWWEVLYYWVQVFAVWLPLLQTLLGVAIELLVLVLQGCFGLLISDQLLLQLLFSPHLFLLHLALQVISILLVKVFPEFVITIFLIFQVGKFGFPGFFEFLVFLLFLLLFSFSSLNLFFQGFFILMFQDFLFSFFFPLDLCLFLLKFIDLRVQSFDLVVLDLT